MTRRAGMTLVETLVAIFIMAIGLLALLTLFPLGALNMAQAIKDQRVAEAGRNAGAIADMTWEDNPVFVSGATPPTTPNQWTMRSDPEAINGMLDPSGTTPYPSGPAPAGSTYPPYSPPYANGTLPSLVGQTTPSYPVLIDPIGWRSTGSAWVAPLQAAGYTGIPRRTMRILLPYPPAPANAPPGTAAQYHGVDPATSTAKVFRWTTLQDDITFDENGVPDQTPGSVQREGRYSWAWLLQAPSATAANSVVGLKVLVFSGRSLDLNSNLGAQEENSYIASFGTDPDTNVSTPRMIYLQWGSGQPKPNLTANSWVLDATLSPTPSANFYRVLNVTDTGTSSTTGNSRMDVEVQTDLKTQGPGFVIVFDKLVEVIDRLQY
ncbi:MAG TPA: prepilin-type N-terminal cleavage/methylation domain-containing protein [Gemmataceae bacterium]|nr:prepilin-type N-terminal cleavage/methylation domain-containing protein [Gemmataceae bacterium]